MMRCLGDYSLRLVTKKLERFESSTVTDHWKTEKQSIVAMSRYWSRQCISKCEICRGLYLSKSMLNLLKSTNIPTSRWIIPPSLRNNGRHCVFVQVGKLVCYFSSRVPFSLHGELSSFSHLKQGNRVCPYEACYHSECTQVVKGKSHR